jgi:HlyD family secretion protein
VTNETSAQAALNRSKINLRYATIIAPISGVVVSRAVDVGQTVAASFSTPTMFTIANDLTKMQVQASIDESDIGKIKVDQEVKFTVDAYPELTFNGIVRQVRLQPVVSQNVVNYTVIIDVPNDELKLLPGMTANITVMIDESKDILKVPATALRFSPPQEYLDEMMKNMPDSLKRQQPKDSGGSRMPGMGTGQGTLRTRPGMPGQISKSQQGGAAPAGGVQKERPKKGLIWIKEGDQIKPHRVIIGLTDGSYTEVRGRDLAEGAEVVLGTNGTTKAQSGQQQQQQSPFAPQRPPSGRGGR